MPSGGFRKNAGRPKGSGSPVRRVLAQMSETSRKAAEELVERINNSSSNPLWVMAEMCADQNLDPALRLMAAKSLAPYTASPMPAHAMVQHQHEHSLVVDPEETRRLIMDRFAALRPRTLEIEAEPVTYAHETVRTIRNVNPL